MLVIVMWEPDEECTDPKAPDEPRRHAEVIDDDVLVLWRSKSGNQDSTEGGYRWHVATMGVFQNVSAKTVRKAMRKIGLVDL